MNFRLAKSRLFAGVVAVVVLAGVAVGALELEHVRLERELENVRLERELALKERVRELALRERAPGYVEPGPALGPGRIAFVSDRDGDAEIYVMNADGSGVEQLTDNDSVDRDPAWSPDGGRLAFVSDRGNDAEFYDIYVMNADGSGVEQLTDGCSNYRPAWSPDGGRVAFSSRGDIFVMYLDGAGVVQLTGSPHESCSEVFYSDRDGDGRTEAYIRSADGSFELLTDYDLIDRNSSDWFTWWSPDGERILFQSHRDGDWEIYVMNADGGDVVQLTDNEWWDLHPSWSSDGGRIVFTSDRENNRCAQIYVMNVDGSGVERLTYERCTDHLPALSPDGGRIVFTSQYGPGDSGIFVMNADGSEVVRLADGYSPAWSPLLE